MKREHDDDRLIEGELGEGELSERKMDDKLEREFLVIGYDGMLGRAWCELLDRHGISYSSPTLDEFDLTKMETVKRYVNKRCKVVVNCGAYTDVDGAETDTETAELINGHAVGELAIRCKAVGAKLIHYSTDYVFGGDASEPYVTDARHEPVNAYGRSKAIGEELIEGSGCDYLIVRTSWMYGPWGKNFVGTIANLTRHRDTIRVVDDQRGRPTSCEHLARISLELVKHGAGGIYHVTDGGECTWHEFAMEIANEVKSSCVVEACKSDEYQRAAKRPMYSVLDLSKTEAVVGAMPSWRKNLAAVLRRLEK